MDVNALVVGASSGIGREAARQLAQRGANVAVSSRREERLRSLAGELRADHGVRAVAIPGDAGDARSAQRIVAGTVEQLGGIDVCVCAAGVFRRVPYERIDADAWHDGLRNTLDPMVHISTEAVRRMLEQGSGRIVLVSSVDDRASEPQAAPYNAAKAATSSLVRSMAVDLAGRGIQANAVAPGLIATEMSAASLAGMDDRMLARANLLGRAGRADEIANVITYLALDAPEFLVGETIFVDGGQLASSPRL